MQHLTFAFISSVIATAVIIAVVIFVVIMKAIIMINGILIVLVVTNATINLPNHPIVLLSCHVGYLRKSPMLAGSTRWPLIWMRTVPAPCTPASMALGVYSVSDWGCSLLLWLCSFALVNRSEAPSCSRLLV